MNKASQNNLSTGEITAGKPPYNEPQDSSRETPSGPEAGNARSLLRRKRLKGEEVGRALLCSLVHDYEQRDSESPKPLFTQDDLTRMVAALPSEYERRIYADYVDLHDSLLSLFREAQGQLQQLQHGLHRLSSRISIAEVIGKLDSLLTPISQNTLDPAVASLPRDVHSILTDDFRSILDSKELQAELQSGRDRMVRPAYVWLVGYNATLSVFADGLSMPDLQALQIPLESVRSEAETYDIMIVRCMHERLDAEDARALRRICPPLSLEKIQPDADVMELLTREVKAAGPIGCNAYVAPAAIMAGRLEEE